jgi:hypothetical protein
LFLVALFAEQFDFACDLVLVAAVAILIQLKLTQWMAGFRPVSLQQFLSGFPDLVNIGDVDSKTKTRSLVRKALTFSAPKLL